MYNEILILFGKFEANGSVLDFYDSTIMPDAFYSQKEYKSNYDVVLVILVE